MTKDLALETIKGFPNQFEVDVLLKQLILVDKVEKGLKELEQRKTIPHENVRTRARLWKK
jgi:hypothetical protein